MRKLKEVITDIKLEIPDTEVEFISELNNLSKPVKWEKDKLPPDPWTLLEKLLIKYIKYPTEQWHYKVLAITSNKSTTEIYYSLDAYRESVFKVDFTEEPFNRLLSFKPEGNVESLFEFLAKEGKYELDPQDCEAPFFSEAFLYNLLGKDDARAILSLINNVKVRYDEMKKKLAGK